MLFGELAALSCSFLWAGTSLCFSEASKRIGSLQLNINRLILASLFLFAAVVISGSGFTLLPEQYALLAVSGLVGLVFGDSFLFKSYVRIGPRKSMLLMSMSPGIAALLGYMVFGESISVIGIAGMLVTLGGVALVVGERTQSGEASGFSLQGLLFGFFAALGQAGGLILAKQAFALGSVNPFLATFTRIAASVIFFLLTAATTGKYKNPVRVYRQDHAALRLTVLGTVLGPFLGITASLIAVANAPVGIAATLMSIVPVTMLPLLKIVYNETVSWRGIAGALIAVAGVGLLFLH